MSEVEHTPEPWFVAPEDRDEVWSGSEEDFQHEQYHETNWNQVAYLVHDENYAADAARIVACVNALAGLNPDAIRELVEAAEAVESWASRLYTVLTEWDLNGEKPDPVEALKLQAVWDDVARLRTALQRVQNPK